MASNFEHLSKQQLLTQISLLQAEVKKDLCNDQSSAVKHDLEVHQIELEMQNRELREAQQQLEETRDNYADLYDFAPVNYFTFSEKGIIEKINLTGASMLGKVRANIIGSPFSRWLDKDSLNKFRDHLNTVFQTDGKVSDELNIKNEAGDRLEVRIESIRSKYTSSNNYECRSIVLDITESNNIKNKLFLQARQLKLITDALPVLISYIDLNEKHLFANKIYMYSFDSTAKEVIGHSVSEVWGTETYKNIKKQLKYALAGQQMTFEMELPLGGSGLKYFNTTFIPDKDDADQVYGVIVLIGDITSRVAIESIDRKRLLEIAHINRLSTMGEMATEIAHELNQPLTAISIYSDACRRLILSGQGEQEQIIQSLRDINVQAERAGEVLRRIREFASKKDLLQQEYNINTIVEEALDLLKVEIRTRNVALKLILEDDLPEIYIDKILIEQVIFNLVRNALEAMDSIDESLRILEIHTSKINVNEIEVSVDDTGPGLSVSKIKRLFEPFYTSKSQGMGMGLTISNSIIEAHHGRIWAAQNDHGGTTFVFTLPQIIKDNNDAA